MLDDDKEDDAGLSRIVRLSVIVKEGGKYLLELLRGHAHDKDVGDGREPDDTGHDALPGTSVAGGERSRASARVGEFKRVGAQLDTVAEQGEGCSERKCGCKECDVACCVGAG